jgi:hypothetical protein
MTSRTKSIQKRKSKYAYQMLVWLADSVPTIWRQISAPGNMTLADLHRIIQVTMGWDETHLHVFTVGRHYYGATDDEWSDEILILPDNEFTLDQILGTKVKSFIYEHNFGSRWRHGVDVQMVMIADDNRNGWPMCLSGANACPPDGVGGLRGYLEFLEAIRDPLHENHDSLRRCLYGQFDPTGFDINLANREIRKWFILGY